jgi:hypothetical protein
MADGMAHPTRIHLLGMTAAIQKYLPIGADVILGDDQNLLTRLDDLKSKLPAGRLEKA